jgi:hypothetical protein
MKEAWYILIQNIGDIMMEDFDDIRAGWPSHVWKKDGSKWRLYPSLLTHEKLVLFKNEEVRSAFGLFFCFRSVLVVKL